MGVRLILGFAISFAVLINSPALLPQPAWTSSLLRLGELVDLVGVLVLIVGYYLLYRSADDWSSEPPSGLATALFLVGAVLFIDGHGIHLAANSIGHYLEPTSSAYAITYFYDEVLGHYLVHGGILALALTLLWRHYQPVKKGVDLWNIRRRQRAGLALASLLYGITIALAAIEGQTVALDLSAAVVIAALFGLSWWRQRQVPGGPAFAFLGLGYVVATVGIAIWGIYWRSFPQFSELGIIH